MAGDTLYQIITIGCIVAFAVVVGVLVLAFVRGLFRGWKYGTYRLIAFAVLITVALVTLRPLANFIGNLDFSNLNFHTQFTVNNTAINVDLSTLYATGQSVIEQILKAYGTSASSETIAAYALALAQSLVMLLLMFIDGLLLGTLGQLFVLLLWHIAFKHIIPVEQRKIKKLRWLSGLEDATIGVLILAMMLFPFTSIVNSLNNHYDRDDAKAANDSNVTLFTNAINTYNDSIFSKVFFNWTKGDGTDSFDTQLVSFLTQGQYGDMKANLVSSVGEVTDIANIAVKSGILSAASSGKIQAGMIIGSDVIPELLYTFSDSTLVQNLLPVGIAIATSLDQVKSVLGTDTCAYLASASVDWSKELSNLGDIYRHVAATGVLDSLVDSEGNFKFEPKDLLGLFSTSSNAYGALHAVFSSIDDLSVFNHLVAGALATFVSSDDQKDDGDPATLQLVDFLPKDSSGKVTSDSLMKVEWGNELMRVYDSLYRLNLVDATILSTIFSSFTASSSNSSTAPLHTLRPATSASSTSSSADPGTAIFNTLIHAFAEHSAQVKTILVGATDSFGNLTDANSDGTSSSGCLFDSTLVQTALPSLLNFAAASLNSNTTLTGGKTIDLSSVITTLNGDGKPATKLLNYKGEFAHLFDVISEFAGTSAGLAFVADPNTLPGIYYDPDGNFNSIDPDLLKVMKAILIDMDSSKVLSNILPALFDGYMSGDNNPFKSLGLDLTFDFSCANLGSEFARVLTTYENCSDVFSALTGGSLNASTASTLLENTDELVQVLDLFANSKIMNPVVNGKSNTNFYKILNYMLTSLNFEIDPNDSRLQGLQIGNTTTLDGSYLLDSSGNPIYDGETGKLGAVFAILGGSGVIDQLQSLSGMSATDATKVLSQIDFESLFSAIGDSKIMSVIAGPALDTYASSILQPGDLEKQISFKNITDWAKEGKNFQTLIDCAAQVGDLSKIDFFSTSPTLIKNLIEAMASSQIFGTGDNYVFPTYLYQKLVGSLSGDSLKYFCDEGVDLSDTTNFPTDTLEAKSKLTKQFKIDIESLNTPDAWSGSSGEAAKFANLFKDIGQIDGGMSGLNSITSAKVPGLLKLLADLPNVTSVGRVLTYNALNSLADSLGGSSGSIDFSTVNADYLMNPAGLTKTVNTFNPKGLTTAVNGLVNPTAAQRVNEISLRQEEIAKISNVVSTVFDSTYGVVDNAGQVNLSSLKLGSVSTDYLLDPLLDGLSGSHVFNALGPSVSAKTETLTDSSSGTAYNVSHLTVFESAMDEIVKVTKLYGNSYSDTALINGKTYYVNETPLNSKTSMSLPALMQSITTSNSWGDSKDASKEIGKLSDLVNFLQTSDFVKNGDFDTSALNDLATFFSGTPKQVETKKVELTTLLSDLNDSAMLYRALPSKLAEALSNVDGTSEIGSEVKLYADAYCMASGTDLLPYPSTEIDNLISIMVEMNDLSSSSASLSNISSLDVTTLTDVLERMSTSRIFNATDSNQVVTTLAATDVKYGHTCFQLIMGDFLKSDALSIDNSGTKTYFFYGADNPKDKAAAFGISLSYTYNGQSVASTLTYSSLASKAYAYGDFYFPALTERSAFLTSGSESLANLLTTLQSPEYSAIFSGSSFNLSSISGDEVSGLLNTLNANALFYDCVPNAINSLLGDSTLAVDGVDTTLANPYFSYYEDANGVPASKGSVVVNYSNRYYAEDIDNLACFVGFLKANKDSISNMNIDKVDPYMVRSLLIQMYDSYLFYLGGVNSDASHYSATTIYDTANKTFTDLTVFEQMIAYLYDKSNLASRAYSSYYDYLDYGVKYTTSAYLYKLHAKIVAFSAGTLNSLHTGDWLAEIDAITTDCLSHSGSLDDPYVGLLSTVQKLGIASGSSVAFNPSMLQSYTPAKLNELLYLLNDLDLVHDALTYTIRNLLTIYDENGTSTGFRLNQFSSDTVMDVTKTTKPNMFSSDGKTFAFANESGLEGLTLTTAASSTSAPTIIATLYGVEHNITTTVSTTPGSHVYTYDLSPFSTASGVTPIYAEKFTFTSDQPIVSVNYSYDTPDYLLTQKQLLTKRAELGTSIGVATSSKPTIYGNGTTALAITPAYSGGIYTFTIPAATAQNYLTYTVKAAVGANITKILYNGDEQTLSAASVTSWKSSYTNDIESLSAMLASLYDAATPENFAVTTTGTITIKGQTDIGASVDVGLTPVVTGTTYYYDVSSLSYVRYTVNSTAEITGASFNGTAQTVTPGITSWSTPEPSYYSFDSASNGLQNFFAQGHSISGLYTFFADSTFFNQKSELSVYAPTPSYGNLTDQLGHQYLSRDVMIYRILNFTYTDPTYSAAGTSISLGSYFGSVDGAHGLSPASPMSSHERMQILENIFIEESNNGTFMAKWLKTETNWLDKSVVNSGMIAATLKNISTAYSAGLMLLGSAQSQGILGDIATSLMPYTDTNGIIVHPECLPKIGSQILAGEITEWMDIKWQQLVTGSNSLSYLDSGVVISNALLASDEAAYCPDLYGYDSTSKLYKHTNLYGTYDAATSSYGFDLLNSLAFLNMTSGNLALSAAGVSSANLTDAKTGLEIAAAYQSNAAAKAFSNLSYLSDIYAAMVVKGYFKVTVGVPNTYIDFPNPNGLGYGTYDSVAKTWTETSSAGTSFDLATLATLIA